MVSVESTTTIARPAEDVFGYVADVRNDPQWHTDVLEARIDDHAPIGKGTVFDISFKPFMGESSGTITVREYDPPNKVVLEGRMGRMEPVVTYRVEPDGDGARFSRHVVMRAPLPIRAMMTLMRSQMRKRNEGYLANLKRALER